MGISAAALTAVEVVGALEAGSAALGAVELAGAGAAIAGAGEAAAIGGGFDAAGGVYSALEGGEALSMGSAAYYSPAVAAGTAGAVAPYAGYVAPGLLDSALSSKVTQSVLGNAAGSVVSSALGAKGVPGVKAPPEIAPPVAMPLPDDQAVANARRRSIAAQQARQGRLSTILSQDQSQTLGN